MSVRDRRRATAFRLRGVHMGSALLAALGALSVARAQSSVDGCTDALYLDRSAANADRSLAWDYSFAGDPERCITVRVGQSVRWLGNFGDHPLDADEGDQPSPIVDHADGLVRFERAGIYGYRCNFHLAMRGAVRVIGNAAPVPTNGGVWLYLLALSLPLLGARALEARLARSGLST